MDLNQTTKTTYVDPSPTPEEFIEAYSNFLKCSYGVDVKDSNGNYKSIYNTLLEVSNNRYKVDMFKMANIFQTNHRSGTVSNVTDYSFKFTTVQKNDKVKEVIYFESYFVEL